MFFQRLAISLYPSEGVIWTHGFLVCFQVALECLYNREKRMGIDLVHDDVEKNLIQVQRALPALWNEFVEGSQKEHSRQVFRFLDKTHFMGLPWLSILLREVQVWPEISEQQFPASGSMTCKRIHDSCASGSGALGVSPKQLWLVTYGFLFCWHVVMLCWHLSSNTRNSRVLQLKTWEPRSGGREDLRFHRR